jgi:hypothetical protein
MSQKVLHDWDDLDNWEDFDISNKVVNKNLQKIIEERKLVEEADNELTESLFSQSSQTIKQETNCESIIHKNISKKTSTVKKELKIGNKEVLEKKQKELSIKIKTNKEHLKRQKEIFGGPDDDDYIKYSDIEIKYLD